MRWLLLMAVPTPPQLLVVVVVVVVVLLCCCSAGVTLWKPIFTQDDAEVDDMMQRLAALKGTAA